MSEMPEQPRIIYPSVEVLPRELDSGMGQAVAERTILRKKDDGSFETWGDVAKRVAVGNTMLDPEYGPNDVDNLYAHISKATLLMSGRHLQHGDENQIMRNIDAFSNCSTSATTFGLFYLLLNGSGVGRSYDDALMLVDWSKAPSVVCVLDEDHPDFDSSVHKTPDWAKAIYSYDQTEWFMVPDSREGWAKAVEIWETMAFAGDKSDFVLILDFSEVRMKGSPIAGMQNRPSSGPVPLMLAFEKAMEICNTSMDNWMQAMFIDHYFAECVVVGGARRAARLAAKSWKDKSVIEFIKIKSSNSDVKLIHGIDTFLWSANNSVLSDEDFWDIINNDADHELKDHAKAVWEETTKAAYFDGTGEPAFINADKLTRNDEGLKEYVDGKYVGYWKYKIDENTSYLMSQLAVAANGMDNNMIVNPCGEIPLHVLSGLCVIADTVPFHASTIREGEDAFRAAARGLIRVNLMKGLYSREVQRTNRIGVGITGIHEFAWKFFKVGFRALVNPNFDEYMDFVNAAGNINDAMNHENAGVRAAAFWLTMNRFGRAAIEEADSYAEKLGVVKPHTCLTVKPAGCQKPSTLVTTSDGLLRLDEIGDVNGKQWQDHTLEVLTEDGNKISNKFFVNGKAKTKKIITDGGIELESTVNHKYRIIRDNKYMWCRADEISVGDLMPYIVGNYSGGSYQHLKKIDVSSIATSPQMTNNFEQPDLLDEDIAWFLGMYYGDGSNHKRSLRISGDARIQKGFSKIKRIAREYFGLETSVHDDGRENHNGAHICMNSIYIGKWLEANGIKKEYSIEIEIPLLIRKSPISVIEAFIDGYRTADGCISKDHGTVSYCTTSRTWAEQLVTILRMIGRDAKLREMPPTDSSYGTRMRYWVSERKGRLASHRYIKKYIKEAWGILDNIDKQHMHVDVVVGIEDSECLTYDIEVSDNHNYVANSYISHNTTSKLFGLTEGVHLSSMAFYIRWVQFRNGDPLIEEYKEAGYPVKELKSYNDTTVIGFPTAPTISKIGMGDELVTAGDATPEEQYQWLMLLEKFYLIGVDPNTMEPLHDRGGQISYTLKYKPSKVSYETFVDMMKEYQPKIKCCSVMPQTEDTSVYEYLPEEPISEARYNELMENIHNTTVSEDIGQEHVECEGGACPIDFSNVAKSNL